MFSSRKGGNRTYAYRLEGQMLNHYAAAIAVLLGGRSAVLCKTMLSCAHGCSYKRLIQREHAPRGAFVSLDTGRLQAGIDQKGPAIALKGEVTVELKLTCSSPARLPRRSTSSFTDLKLHIILDCRRGCHGPRGTSACCAALNIVLVQRLRRS